jgi:hypothetical protein
MTKAGQTVLQRKPMEWIAVGAFADAAPLAAAATELISVGVPPSDLCLAGLPVSMQRVATAAEVCSVDRLAHLLKGAVEVRLAGSEDAILAVPSCLGNPSSFFSPAIADRLEGRSARGAFCSVPAPPARRTLRRLRASFFATACTTCICFSARRGHPEKSRCERRRDARGTLSAATR